MVSHDSPLFTMEGMILMSLPSSQHLELYFPLVKMHLGSLD